MDIVASKGEMDVIDDLSYPLPVTVFAELLGIPLIGRERFKDWSDQVVGATPYRDRDAQEASSLARLVPGVGIGEILPRSSVVGLSSAYDR